MNSQWTTSAIQAALRAGDLLRKGFGTPLEIIHKPGRHNVVTQYDFQAEGAILSFLEKEFPDHAFLAEESGGANQTTKPLWLIDPLDGTMNFSRGIPQFTVSIALFHEGKTQVGVVYQPITQELFVAQRGWGAFLNGKQIRVSGIDTLDHSALLTSLAYDAERPANAGEILLNIAKQSGPIRDFGSAALHLAYVAAGRFEGYWAHILSPWDFAAGTLLVEEAGGQATTTDGSPLPFDRDTSVVASNRTLHQELLSKE
ncbi:MAG: inositol monophosphatase [Chlamydiia bacterium]|nr:inositol monophosphatase [Chlamydiia bacterium]